MAAVNRFFPIGLGFGAARSNDKAVFLRIFRFFRPMPPAHQHRVFSKHYVQAPVQPVFYRPVPPDIPVKLPGGKLKRKVIQPLQDCADLDGIRFVSGPGSRKAVNRGSGSGPDITVAGIDQNLIQRLIAGIGF